LLSHGYVVNCTTRSLKIGVCDCPMDSAWGEAGLVPVKQRGAKQCTKATTRKSREVPCPGNFTQIKQ
jgi:hypothetical protein